MYVNLLRSKIEKLLNSVDIKINGTRPWDIHVNNERFFQEVLALPRTIQARKMHCYAETKSDYLGRARSQRLQRLN